MRLHSALPAGVSWLIAAAVSAAPSAWRVDKLSLKIDSDRQSTLALKVSNLVLNQTIDLRAKVRLTAVEESFVVGDKLGIIGRAGRASEVVVFDLARRQETDRFGCILPRRVSDTWIAYVELYLDHGTVEPREVVLVYDLARSPLQNRLPTARNTQIPPPISAVSTQVGIPVYPEWNVRNRSYRNVVENPAEGETLVPTAPFLLLGSDRLVFVARQGFDFLSSWDYLVIINLAAGLEAPVITTLDIPKQELRKPGENPRFVKIDGMETVEGNPDAVRLLVPAAEYGVSSIVVRIPG